MASNKLLTVGDCFLSFAEFEEKLHQFQIEEQYKLSKKNSRLLPAGHEKLKYYEVNYWCPHGGEFVSKGTGVRQLSSQKINCPAKLQIRVDKDRNYLKIIQIEYTHNHSSNKRINQHNPTKPKSQQCVAEKRKALLRPVVDKVMAILIDAPADEYFEQGLEATTTFLRELQLEFDTKKATCRSSARSCDTSIESVASADNKTATEGSEITAQENFDRTDKHLSSTGDMTEPEVDGWLGTASALCSTSYGVPGIVETPTATLPPIDLQYDEIDESLLVETAETVEKKSIRSHESASINNRASVIITTAVRETYPTKDSTFEAIGLDKSRVLGNVEIDSVKKVDLTGENIITTSSEINLTSIVMPNKVPTKGRPKGAALTAIGRPRKVDTSKAFYEKREQRKVEEILSWLVKDWMVEVVVKGEYRIQREDLELTKLRDSLVDEEVDINIVARFIEPEAFIELQKAVNKKKEDESLSCKVCREIIEGRKSVLCDRCLLWHHHKCVGLTRAPKGKKWFCSSCKKS